MNGIIDLDSNPDDPRMPYLGRAYLIGRKCTNVVKLHDVSALWGDVDVWCRDIWPNLEGVILDDIEFSGWHTHYAAYGDYVGFRNLENAVLFKLRWG